MKRMILALAILLVPGAGVAGTLLPEHIEKVVELFADELVGRLHDQGVELRLSDEARAWIEKVRQPSARSSAHLPEPEDHAEKNQHYA